MKQHTKDIPTDMPTDNRPINRGKSMNDDTSRLDAVAKVTGKAKFSMDQYLDNQLFVAFIRCPYGSATLERYDKEAASSLDGILEVQIDNKNGKYHGHPIGHIVAESVPQLRRAMRALNPQWSRSRSVTSLADGADEIPETTSETESLLTNADHILEAIYSTPAQTHSPLETHGAVVDHRGDSATIYASTQGTFATLDGASRALNLPNSKIEVIAEYVGGGFGSKLGMSKEGALAGKISAKYKRPTRLFTDRAEDQLDTGYRPSSQTWVKVGFNNDGTILGGQIQTWGGVGIARRGGGCSIPSGKYKIGNIKKSHKDVQFASCGPRAFRAPGRPQGAFAEELMLDEIAMIAGIDPLDLRLKIENSSPRKEMFKLGAELIGWNQRKQTGSQTGTLVRGFGMGSSDWGRFQQNTDAEVVIARDGSVEAKTGTQDIGTGQRTIMGIVVSEYLGVSLDQVSVSIGSSRNPRGPGSGGSMTAHNTVPAMIAAAVDAKSQILEIAKKQLNKSDLDLVDAVITSKGEKVMSLADLCARMPQENITGSGSTKDADTKSKYGGEGHSHGVQFADVEVDSETGVIQVNRIVAIQSCGRVVCRKTAESQIIGAVIQGLSYALFENKLLDRNTGSMVNADLEAYKIAGTKDIPLIEPVLWTKGQTGVRSLGEPPTIPTAGAIACAVFNAIGSPVRHLPLTPAKVLIALEGSTA